MCRLQKIKNAFVTKVIGGRKGTECKNIVILPHHRKLEEKYS